MNFANTTGSAGTIIRKANSGILVKQVTSEKELSDVFSVRYRVYCLERGYERLEDYPNGLEMDEYDPYSIHFIAYVDSLPVGTARLILPNPIGFPVERYCNVDIRAISPDTNRVAEISRLAVSSEASRGLSISRGLITAGLIREMYYANKFLDLGITYAFTAMSKGLERMLMRCGICFIKAGASVEYHGIRTPYYVPIKGLTNWLTQSIFKHHFTQDASLSEKPNSYPLYG